MATIIPVILCDGSGARLGPVSRRDFAKRHAPIFDGRSPFQATLARISEDARFGAPIVIAGGPGRFMTAGQAAAIGVEIELALEPLGCVHRLANPGRVPVETAEVQTGAGLEEDDSVRIEDDFGRR